MMLRRPRAHASCSAGGNRVMLRSAGMLTVVLNSCACSSFASDLLSTNARKKTSAGSKLQAQSSQSCPLQLSNLVAEEGSSCSSKVSSRSTTEIDTSSLVDAAAAAAFAAGSTTPDCSTELSNHALTASSSGELGLPRISCWHRRAARPATVFSRSSRNGAVTAVTPRAEQRKPQRSAALSRLGGLRAAKCSCNAHTKRVRTAKDTSDQATNRARVSRNDDSAARPVAVAIAAVAVERSRRHHSMHRRI